MSSANKVECGLRAEYGAAISHALRQFVGLGKLFRSSRALEAATDVPWRAIEAARCEPTDPEHRPLKGEYLCRIGRKLGPEFNTLWMARLMGQGAYAMPEAKPISPREVACDTVDDAAKVNRCLGDDVCTRDDARELKPVGLRMLTIGAALAFGAVAAV